MSLQQRELFGIFTRFPFHSEYDFGNHCGANVIKVLNSVTAISPKPSPQGLRDAIQSPFRGLGLKDYNILTFSSSGKYYLCIYTNS